MNWGAKIVVVYSVFVAGIVTLVVLSSAQNQDLVTKDYYEQELKYQERINEKARVQQLSDSLIYSLEGKNIRIQFPPEMQHAELQADVFLYYPADEKGDRHLQINSSNGTLMFPLVNGKSGLHIIKLSWQALGKNFYTEHKILLP